jgi:hypothetical protein
MRRRAGFTPIFSGLGIGVCVRQRMAQSGAGEGPQPIRRAYGLLTEDGDSGSHPKPSRDTANNAG